MRRNLRNRILSFMLAVVMVIGMIPGTAMTAFAEEGTVTETPAEGEKTPEVVAVTGIALDQEAVEVKEGETVTLTATVSPEDATDKTVTWTSDNEAVATVADGVVTAVAEGTANVTATAGEFSASCAVTVKTMGNDPVDILEASKTSAADYAVMMLADDGIATVAEKKCDVTDNVIDITDYTVAKESNKYVNAISITISGATVISATEDGTTVNILLDGATEKDIAVNFSFGIKKSFFSASGTKGSVTLENGEATANLEIIAKMGKNPKGSVIYTLNFTVDKPPAEVPVRLKDSDNAQTIIGTAVDFKLDKYFSNASSYYLVDRDKKDAIEGNTYTFKKLEKGTYTLVFAASNLSGECSDYVTVTVTVNEIESGCYIGKTSTHGSLDYVYFEDANGDPISDLSASVEGNRIDVTLSETYDANGTITARFERTADKTGRPFVTASNDYLEASKNKMDAYTTTLINGNGSQTVYFYAKAPDYYSNDYETLTINYSMSNKLPVLTDQENWQESHTITAGDELTINLAGKFTDVDSPALTYKCSVDGGAYEGFSGTEYTFAPSISGTYELRFKANDGVGDSGEYYAVTVTVENSSESYSVNVEVPEDITPEFSITRKFDSDGIDVLGETLTANEVDTVDGVTKYTVSIPDNISRISCRDSEDDSGMSFATKDSAGNAIVDTIRLVKVQGKLIDYSQKEIEGTMSLAEYESYKAVKGNNRYLLCAGMEYTFTAAPDDAAKYVEATKKETVTVPQDAEVYTVVLEVPYKDPITITAPTGATAELYTYESEYGKEKYYNCPEYESVAVKDNGDGTSTTYFAGKEVPASVVFLYRVTYKDYIVKAGWTTKNVTVTFNENDLKSSARVDYKSSSDTNATVAEDSVLLNVNGQNNLVLSKVGDTKTLKAYRAWEIIPFATRNAIISPNFHYDIISGDDVITLEKAASHSTTDTDWKKLTAKEEGTAIIEVTYDAVNVSGSDWNGTYGASDPARTGLVVVQVGGHDSSVDFGIECFTSQGSMTYTQTNAKDWDAEFDTLYFTGDSGELKLSPTAGSRIQRVQVSADKGNRWTTLVEKDGTYTAQIAHGNNIIRVITDEGTAYQVVRGYKVQVKYREVSGAGDGDGIIEAGETIRVTLEGLHQPIPKMAGNYNPGFRGNQDGDSGVHLKYTFNGEIATHGGSQYDFITTANWVEVAIPEDSEESSFKLTNGYIGTGVIGLTGFADGVTKSHRDMPDACDFATRESITTFNTRSILPEITINIGDQSSSNSAPYVNGGAVTAAQIELGQTYALNPEILFSDADGEALFFTVSIDGGTAVAADKTFTFEPDVAKSYEITFTATDGKLTAPQHTVTLTVAAATQKEDTLVFDITGSKIKGYVTVGFEDNGIREDGLYGLEFPVALGTIIEPTPVPFAEGDTIAEVTLRLLDALDIGYEYSGAATKGGGFYLKKIKNFVVNKIPYDEMGQQDAGSGSGWMITNNDWFIDQGASEFLVQSGDKIQWKYTCQLGADIGDNSWESVVGEVEDLIDAIGSSITLDSIGAITAAREAYDALSDFYQSKVENYNDLLVAEQMLEELIENGATDNDKAAAAAVDALINSIGEVGLDSAQAIEDARKAYDALTPIQKYLVTKLETLETAENQLKQLNSTSHEEVYHETGEYLINMGIPAVGSTGGEWMVIGLARGNKGLSGTTTDGYYNGVSQYIDTVFSKNNALKQAVRLDESKSTDNARVILGLTAAGIDATNVNGYNLFDGLDEMSYIKYQGVNGPMWVLIALNSHPSYKDELSGDVTEAKLIQAVLDAQLSDRGWDLANKAADVDMTAMAVQALAPYYNTNSAVKEAVDKALAKLSSMQQSDGSFASVDGINTESTAQVIVALTSLGINPEEDSRFIKKGMSAVDALCNYAVNGGGFMHTPNTARDGMATEQGYYALVSYFRLLNGETSLYDMSGVTLKTGKINPNAPSAYDIAAAKAVEKIISAIGKVTIYSNLKIDAARSAYDKLTSLQKKCVTNYETLVKAEKEYEKIVDEAVKNVEDLIDAIGEVTLESAEDISKARLAYNQLPPHVQKLVENLDKLEAAEKELEKLRKEALELLAAGKLVLSKSELLKLKDEFEAVTEQTTYDEALKLLLTYYALGEKQQLALAGSEKLELLQNIVAKVNHTNPSTGITMYGLDWNIRVVTKALTEENNEIRDQITEKLSDTDLLSIWDIYLENILTGEKYSLEKVIEVWIPVELVGDYTFYDRLGVVHYMDDGQIEVLNCKVIDGYVVFNAIDFSYYAVVGFMDSEGEKETVTGNVVVQTPEYEELIEKAEAVSETDNSWIIWAGTAGAGIVLLAVLFILRKRMSAE